MKLLACFLLAVAIAIPALAADVTGKWSGSFTDPGGDTQSAYIVLKQTGTAITGSGGPDENQQWPIEKGKFEGNKLTGEVRADNGGVYRIALVLDGDHLKGDVTIISPDGQTFTGKMDVARVK